MKRNPGDYGKFKQSQCQINQDCYGQLDPDHVKTFGSGGLNSENNIMTLCRKHHQEKGMKGINYMANKYLKYHLWLISHGWEYDEFYKKWILSEER